MEYFKATVEILIPAANAENARRTLNASLKGYHFGYKKKAKELRYFPTLASQGLVEIYLDAKEHEASCECCRGLCDCVHDPHPCCARTGFEVDDAFDDIFEV